MAGWLDATDTQGCRKRGRALDPPVLAKQLTLSQPGGTDYAHHSTMSPPGFSDLATGLIKYENKQPSPPALCFGGMS